MSARCNFIFRSRVVTSVRSSYVEKTNNNKSTVVAVMQIHLNERPTTEGTYYLNMPPVAKMPKLVSKVTTPAKLSTPAKVPTPADTAMAKKLITDEYKKASIVLEKDNYVAGHNLTNFVTNFFLVNKEIETKYKEECVDFCLQSIPDTKNKRPEPNDNTALSLQLYLASLSKREVVEVGSSDSVVGRKRDREEELVTKTIERFTISDENLDTLLREEDAKLYDIEFRRKALFHEKDCRLNLAKRLFHDKIVERLCPK